MQNKGCVMPLSIRPATSDDRERIIEVLCTDPGDESIALMGSAELALRYKKKLLERERIPDPTRVTLVAQSSDRVVGVLQYGIGSGAHRGRLAHLRLLVSMVGPVGLLRRLPRLWGRIRVEIPTPEDSFYVATLYVDPECSAQGIGSQLLEWAEHEARRVGARSMSVITLTSSDAIPWYEQNGFVKTRTATHPSYTRYLHIEGRVLLEKQLD